MVMLQVKLLHDLIEEMAGENTGRIAEILFKKKDVNEFLIAKKMELTINQVRNILYKLSADNLVSFIRKKDKRKGWYIYYWTLNTEKCLMKLENSLMKKIANFEGVLNSRETKRFYVCKSCDIEVSEEKALENGFSCEECADIYELSDNSRPIREAKTWITRTNRNVDMIRKELEIVQKKKKIARKRASNKLDKEEAKRKELMKIIRAAARKKVAEAKAKAAGKVVKKVKKKVEKKVKKVKKVVKKVKKKVTVTRKSIPSKKGTKVPASSGKKKVKKVVKKKVSLASKLKKKIAGRK
jgi:transcription factor E